MATENAASGGAYPTEDQYVDRTTDEEDVPLPSTDGDMKFRVQETPPLQVIMALKRHDMSSLLDEEKRDDMDFSELLANDSFVAFIEDVVVPNVAKPSVYLSNPDDGSFDLSKLDLEDDLPALLQGIMGVDAIDADAADGEMEFGDSFPE